MTKPAAPTLVFAETLQPSGKVASFSETSSRIEQTDVPGLYQAGITLETWIKPQAVAQTDVVLSFGLGQVYLTLSDATNLTIGFNTASVATGVSLPATVWSQLSLAVAPSVADKLSARLVLNGREVFYGAGALSLDGAVPPGTGDELTLGLRDGETGTAIVGLYSETRLWPRALSTAEIATNQFRRLTPTADGPSLVWSLTAAPAGSTQSEVTYPADTSLDFRADTLTASWTADAQDTYNLRAYATDYSWAQIVSPAATPQALTGYLIGTKSAAVLQSVSSGTPSDWSDPAQGAILRLAQPTVVVQGSIDAGAASLTATWSAVDQATGYAVDLYESGTTGTPQSVDATTFDLTDKLGTAKTYELTVRTVSGISIGPATPPTQLATPAPTLLYDDAGASPSLTLSWPAIAGAGQIYVSWTATNNATPPPAQFVAGSATSLPPITTGLVRDVTYTASVQAVANGGISAAAPVSATTAPVATPTNLRTLTQPKSGSTDGKVTLSWDFTDAVHTNPTFEATIYDAGGAKVGTQTVTQKSCVFESATFEPTAAFTAKVQVKSASVVGPIASTDVFIVPIPVSFNIGYNAMNANLTASWDGVSVPAAPAGKTVTYTLRIQGPLTGSQCDSVPASPTVDFSTTTTDTTVTLAKGDVPNLADNQNYGATVTASVETSSGNPSHCDSMHTEPYVPPVDPPDNPSKGDPVGLASGNFTHFETDLTINGLIPLHFTLYYNSSMPLPADGPIGVSTIAPRWRHAYDTKIAVDAAANKLYVIWGTTDVNVYNTPANGGGRYTPYGPFNGDMLTVEGTGYRLSRKDQTVWHFGANGQPTTVEDRYGNTLTFAYSGGKLTRVSLTDSDNWIGFDYSGDAVETVTGSDGRNLTLGYSGTGLTSVVTALGGTRRFTYSDTSNFLLQQIVDEWGNTVVYNDYDSSERVTKQYDGEGYAAATKYFTTFDYGTTTYQRQTVNTTQVTTPEGEVSLYYSDPDSKLISYSRVDISAGTPIADLVEIKTMTFNGFHVPETQTTYRGALGAYQAGRGNTTTLAYDSNLNRSSIVNAGGRSQSWTYDAANNLLTVVDINGNPTNNEYQSGNRLHQIIDPLGQTVTLDYWAVSGTQKFNGLVKTATDPLGNVTSYAYDSATGLMTTETRPNQDTIAYTYDSSGRVETETEATKGVVQRILSYGYDALDRLSTVHIRMGDAQPDADAFAYHWTYDTPTPNTITKTDPTGTTITTSLNANRAPTVTTYPAFSGVTVTRTKSYDKDGRLSGVARGANPPTQIRYNGLNERVSETDPLGNTVTSFTTQSTAGNGPFDTITTKTLPPVVDGPDTYTYTETSTTNPAGRLQSVAERYLKTGSATPDWARTRSYDYALTKQTQGNYTSYNVSMTQTTTPVVPAGTAIAETTIVDGLYRPISNTDARQATTTIAYAGADMPGTPALKVLCATTTPPAGAPQKSYVDSLGRTVAQSAGSGADASARLYDIDVLNRPSRVRVGDTLDHIASDDFSAPGAADMIRSYVYEKAGNDPRLRVDTTQPATSGDTVATSSVFDGRSNRVSQSYFGTGARNWTFAPWGAVATRTVPTAQTTTYGFDAAGYQVGVTLPTAPTETRITHVLDAAGNRLQTKVNDTEKVTRVFDAWNRESSRTSDQATIGLRYWPNDRLRELTYPDGKTVSYGLNGFGLWDTITDWQNRATQYAYYPTGEVQSITYPNAVVSAFGYNEAGAVTSVSHTGNDAAKLADLTITPDSQNRPAAIAGLWPAPVTLPSATTTIEITDNQVTSFDGTDLSSDPDGALSQTPKPGGGTQAVTYDPTGKLASVDSTEFGYDADGLLAQRTDAGTTETYVVSPNFYQDPTLNLASGKRKTYGAKLVPSGTAGAVFDAVRGAGNAAGCLCMDLDWRLQTSKAGSVSTRYVHGLGPITCDDATDGTTFLHSDHAGNIILATDSNGNPAVQTNFAPYGANRGGASPNTFGFSGRFGAISDPQGLTLMRARALSPDLMRFTSMDMLGGSLRQPTARNRYQYGLNQPGLYADPLGLSPVPLIIGGVIGGAVVVGGLGALCYFFCSSAAAGIGAFFSGAFSSIAGTVTGWFAEGFAEEGVLDPLLGDLGDIELDNLGDLADGDGEFGEGDGDLSDGEGDGESGDESGSDLEQAAQDLQRWGFRRTGPRTFQNSSGSQITYRGTSTSSGIPRF